MINRTARIVAACAAVAVTFTLVTSVVSLAENDKAAIAAAQIARQSALASNSTLKTMFHRVDRQAH